MENIVQIGRRKQGERYRRRHLALVFITASLLAGYVLAMATGAFSAAPGQHAVPWRQNVRADARNATPVIYNSYDSASTAKTLGAGPVRSSHTSSQTLPTQVIRTDDLTVRVPRLGSQHAADIATSVAADYGGFVVSSDRSSGHEVYMVIRVAAADFEKALARLRSLGKVTAENIQGQDVSRQFVDLNARMTNLNAQRIELLKLFRQATSVQDTLRVQNVLSNVQYQIEQTQGTLRYLSNRVSLATISVDIVAKTKKHHKHHKTHPGLIVKAFGDAGNGIIKVIAGAIVVVGYSIPLAVLGFLGFGIYALIRRTPRRSEPAPEAA